MAGRSPASRRPRRAARCPGRGARAPARAITPRSVAIQESAVGASCRSRGWRPAGTPCQVSSGLEDLDVVARLGRFADALEQARSQHPDAARDARARPSRSCARPTEDVAEGSQPSSRPPHGRSRRRRSPTDTPPGISTRAVALDGSSSQAQACVLPTRPARPPPPGRSAGPGRPTGCPRDPRGPGRTCGPPAPGPRAGSAGWARRGTREEEGPIGEQPERTALGRRAVMEAPHAPAVRREREHLLRPGTERAPGGSRPGPTSAPRRRYSRGPSAGCRWPTRTSRRTVRLEEADPLRGRDQPARAASLQGRRHHRGQAVHVVPEEGLRLRQRDHAGRHRDPERALGVDEEHRRLRSRPSRRPRASLVPSGRSETTPASDAIQTTSPRRARETIFEGSARRSRTRPACHSRTRLRDPSQEASRTRSGPSGSASRSPGRASSCRRTPAGCPLPESAARDQEQRALGGQAQAQDRLALEVLRRRLPASLPGAPLEHLPRPRPTSRHPGRRPRRRRAAGDHPGRRPAAFRRRRTSYSA